MSIDWTKPLVVVGTDRVATVDRHGVCDRIVRGDWLGDGLPFPVYIESNGKSQTGRYAVTNAPPTPKLGPQHIEALAEAIENAEAEVAEMLRKVGWSRSAEWKAEYAGYAEAAEQRAARLAEIRAYLESL